MSLDAKRTHVVPDQTAQVTRAIFPKGSPVMRLYDDLHRVVANRDFADLFPARGRPAEAPVRLALATLLQLAWFRICSFGVTRACGNAGL